jgi:hypothetical protein
MKPGHCENARPTLNTPTIPICIRSMQFKWDGWMDSKEQDNKTYKVFLLQLHKTLRTTSCLIHSTIS